MAAHPELKLFSSSTFGEPVANGLIATSPVIDLVATIINTSTLCFWRAGGQPVIKLNDKKPSPTPIMAKAIRWKTDGTLQASKQDRIIYLYCE